MGIGGDFLIFFALTERKQPKNNKKKRNDYIYEVFQPFWVNEGCTHRNAQIG